MKNHQTELLEIWESLELIVVSLDRIGAYEVDHGKAAALQALDEFLNPAVCGSLSNARAMATRILKERYGVTEQLEEIAETKIKYWSFPETEEFRDDDSSQDVG